jgi:hypothetical protein
MIFKIKHVSFFYCVYTNVEFAGFCPACTAHGYFWTDEYDTGRQANTVENIIAVETEDYITKIEQKIDI